MFIAIEIVAPCLLLAVLCLLHVHHILDVCACAQKQHGEAHARKGGPRAGELAEPVQFIKTARPGRGTGG